MITVVNVIFVAIMIILILSVCANVVDLVIGFSDYQVSKSRLKQFQKGTKEAQASMKDQIISITDIVKQRIFPMVQSMLPSLRVENVEQRDKNLKFIGWDDTFTAESFLATSIGLKIVGIVLIIFGVIFYFLMNDIKFLAVFGLLGVTAIFLLDFLYNSDVKNKNSILFADFPDFVRIVSGYLIANMPLVQAIEESIKYVSEDWRPILSQFIVDCNSRGVDAALEGLRNTVNIFEVREFVALVRLTLEQGGDAKESFVEQADKVAEMQKDMFIIKIGKRKTMATIVQFPCLLITMAILALPVLGNNELF